MKSIQADKLIKFLLLICILTIKLQAQGNALKLVGQNDAFLGRAPALGLETTIEFWVYLTSYPSRTSFLFTTNSGNSHQNFEQWTNSMLLEATGKVLDIFPK